MKNDVLYVGVSQKDEKVEKNTYTIIGGSPLFLVFLKNTEKQP